MCFVCTFYEAQKRGDDISDAQILEWLRRDRAGLGMAERWINDTPLTPAHKARLFRIARTEFAPLLQAMRDVLESEAKA